ncbi:MAG: response regulator [Alphaproteobacteria bacterium]|nr:response regulator [Alphaproteobacteria bacterium]
MTAALEGIRVLVVEDEFLVAVLIEEMLESAGCVVIGPFPRVPEALDAVDRDPCDAAVLDVNLGGERIDPVAAALSRRNVPFVFVSGYGTIGLPGDYSDRPRICKPFKLAELLGTVSSLVKPSIAHSVRSA